MILKLDKKDVVRSVEKYYKKVKQENVQGNMGLIYDEKTELFYPYIKIESVKNKKIDYLDENNLKEIFNYTYNCNVNNITIDKAKKVDLPSTDIDSNLYGLTLNVSHSKKRKK